MRSRNKSAEHLPLCTMEVVSFFFWVEGNPNVTVEGWDSGYGYFCDEDQKHIVKRWAFKLNPACLQCSYFHSVLRIMRKTTRTLQCQTPIRCSKRGLLPVLQSWYVSFVSHHPRVSSKRSYRELYWSLRFHGSSEEDITYPIGFLGEDEDLKQRRSKTEKKKTSLTCLCLTVQWIVPGWRQSYSLKWRKSSPD